GTNPNIQAGSVAGGPSGSVIVNGGTLINAQQEDWIGSFAGGYGSITVNSGTFTDASFLALARANSASGAGSGILNLYSGTINQNSNTFTIGSFANGTLAATLTSGYGQATLTGGTFNAVGTVQVGESYRGVLNILGTSGSPLQGSAAGGTLNALLINIGVAG